MMIMKFHKLIQSRLLWLVFLGVLIMSFVGWGVASNTGTDPAIARLERTVVKIDGKDVSFLKFDTTRRLLANQAGQKISDEMLEEMANTHLAMVAYAENIGIQVPEEFASQQFASIFANEEGGVDEDLLENFRTSLRGSYITEADYIRFIQEELISQQLQRTLASSVLVSGFEVDRWAGTQTDSFTVQFAAITAEILESEIIVTDQQLQSFFEENINRFRLPEQRVANFIVIKAVDFMDAVGDIPESEILDAYMASPELYVRSVEQEATEEGGEPTTLQESIPLDEVRDQISTNLKLEKARKNAGATALTHAVKVTPRRGRTGMPLVALAESEGLELQTTGAFSQWETIENLPEGSAVKEAIFKLELNDLGKRAGPIEAGDDFVVVELTEIIIPRLPELDEVKDRVQGSAEAFYTREAVAAKAADVVESIRTTISAEKSFEDLLTENGLSVVSPPPFDLRSLNPNRPVLPPELIQEISSAQTGDVVGPTSSRFGGLFVSYLASRAPNLEAAAELTPQVRQMLAQQLYLPEVFERFRELRILPLIEKIETEAVEVDEETDVEEAA